MENNFEATFNNEDQNEYEPIVKGYREMYQRIEEDSAEKADEYLESVLNNVAAAAESPETIDTDSPLRKWNKEKLEGIHAELLKLRKE